MAEQPLNQDEPVYEDSSIQDLDNAIARQHARLESIDSTHPDRAYMLDQESVVWWFKYKQSGNKDDIEQAVRTAQAAVQAMHPGYADKSTIFSHLSVWLHLRFREMGRLEDLEEAFLNGRLALESLDRGSERWLVTHNNMASFFTERIHLSPSIGTLDEAIEFQLEGIDIQLGRKFTSRYLGRLTTLLIARHKQSRSIKDLEKAIEFGYQAVEMVQFADSAEFEYKNLSAALFSHYQVTNLFSSLTEGLKISRLGLDNETNNTRATALCNHGSMLEAKCQRYRETNSVEAMKALDEAISYGRAALELLNDNDNLTAHVLNMIGAWFATKMKMTKDLTFGEDGAKMLDHALELRRPSHPEHPRILGNLAHIREVQHQILAAQGQKPAALEMLSKAVAHGYEAVNTTDDDDPYLGERRKNLGVMLFSKHLLTEEDATYQQAKKYLILTAKTETAPLLVRIPGAIQAGLGCWEDGELTEANDLLQGAISLLPTLNPHSISTQDLQQTLGQVSGLATFAASIALEAGRSPYEALKSLEEARCVIAGVSMSSKIDISKLRKADPDLANKYDDLRTQLSQASKHLKLPSTYRGARKHQQELLQAVSETEANIRHLPGWESFQLPMTEENIKDLAADGPIIVVNATKVRCDAIVVTTKDIKLIRLHDMKYKDLEQNISLFSRLGNESRRNAVPRRKKASAATVLDALLWLWNVAVRPILDVTELTPSRRVWWITTGLAGRAPFHAAGDHSTGSHDNTFSRVISSYVSSFKALRFARDKKSASIPRLNMLLVTMSSNPPPHHDLDTSHEEQVAKEIFGQSIEHLSHPDPEAVLQRLPQYSVVHFACHGSSIAYDPSQSGLLLVKDSKVAILAISDLEEVDLKEGAIAYLSACSTAEQADGKLADEAIHLANSFQALGFQHVIGTMWGAEDTAAGEVARRFYKRLFSEAGGEESSDHGSLDVARVLHEAMADYMNAAQKSVVSWGPFIHIGV
jgi:CHAT domain-containing protein